MIRHWIALQNFWNYINSNPKNHAVNGAEAAYVLPRDYGFGFRNPRDTIWVLWNADDLSAKVWDDANLLITQYGPGVDIVYNDPKVMDTVKSRYATLFFWNETIS